jgi:hypothetical protein
MESAELEKKARRAYERGRVLLALRQGSPLLLLAAALLLLGPQLWVAAAASALLVITALYLLWRGGIHGRALLPGLGAGVLAWLLPSLSRCATPVCSAHLCLQLCLGGAVTGGVLAGALLAYRARHLEDGRETFLFWAACVALLFAVPGCAIAGGAGVLGMLGGFLAGTGPALLATRST